MPAFAPLTIQDREDTPVNHTFVPKGFVNNGVALYKESHPAGVTIGENILSTQMTETATRNNGILRLSVPVLTQQIGDGGNAEFTVARVARVEVRVSFDKKSTVGERNNALGLVASALSQNVDQVHELFVLNNHAY